MGVTYTPILVEGFRSVATFDQSTDNLKSFNSITQPYVNNHTVLKIDSYTILSCMIYII